MLLAAVLPVFSPGCRAPESAAPAPPGFSEVRDAARRQLTEIRTRGLLRRMGARLAAAEEYRAELTGLIDSFPKDLPHPWGDAGRDPRYRYALEAIAYARLLLLRPAAVTPEEFMRPAAQAEIDFEMLEKLSRLDWERRSVSAAFSSEHHDLELEVRLAAGLSEEQLRSFDFATLPTPRELPAAAAVAPVGAEPLRVARQLFDLPGIAAKSPAAAPPGEAERLIAQEFMLLRRLAREEARFAADPKNFAVPANALLARRLAEGRLIQLDALESGMR